MEASSRGTQGNSQESGRAWTTLQVTLPHELLDAINDFCVDRGSNGVIVEDEDPHTAVVTAYFPENKSDRVQEELTNYLAELAELFPELPAPQFSWSRLDNEDWAVAWQVNFKSMPVGQRLIVTPPWIAPEPSDREIVIIDPADAFGTGTHETTQGCLLLLEEAIAEILQTSESVSLLDVGCGSGILAVAGIKLGAVKATAIDNDPVAVQAAARNAALNSVERTLRIECRSVSEWEEPADIVTANLDPRALVSNRERLVSLAGRFLIVSGVPMNQWDGFKGQFLSDEVILKREITFTEWGCALLGRAGRRQ